MPYRIALWLVRRSVRVEDRDGVCGDLVEAYADRLESGRGAGRLWFWREALQCVAAGAGVRRRQWTRRRQTGRKRGVMLRNVLQDVRYGVRALGRSPLHVAMVVGTLGLGIAANTIVFSAVDGVVLNPFSFPESDRLVGVGTQYPRLGGELSTFENLSPAEYLDIRDGARQLERVVAWDMGNRSVTFGDVTENLFSGFWWGDAFPTLGVQPVYGRGFREEEIREAQRVAILSHRVWSGRFGADPSLVGGTILMNGDPYTVVGIMPPGTLIYGMDLWLPMPVGPEVYPRSRRQFQVLARLAPGATLEQANADLSSLAARVASEHAGEFAEYEGWSMRALTWKDINVRTLRPAALMLVAAVGFVLLLVVANVASLMLARGSGRQREITVRAALGAGRRRILAQLLTESLLLALAGGAVGVLLGWAGVNAVANAVATLALPIPGGIGMNLRVLAFTAGISVLVGLAFGAAPAWQATRVNLQLALQAESQAVVSNASRLRLQRVLVGIEVALALALLVGSGLLIRSLAHLQRIDGGFDARNVLTMRLTLAQERYAQDAVEPFFQELREGIGAIPGVSAVATASQFPPAVFTQRQFEIEGRPADASGNLPSAYTTLVSPAYFEALRIPVLRGRTFTEGDHADSPWYAVLNEAAARRWFGESDPVGQRLRVGEGAPWMEVIGVVGSTRNRSLELEPSPEIFASTLQARGWSNQLFVLVRTEVPPRSVVPAVRQTVSGIDPQQPIYGIQTLEERIAQSQATRRLSLSTLAVFSIFALLLASIGIYGVVAHAVGQRTRELGLRIALGAGRAQVRGLVLRQSLLPVGLGVLAGLLGGFGLGQVMSGMLYGVSGSDAVSLLGAGGLMLFTALLATYLPARRASRLDPVRALRLD